MPARPQQQATGPSRERPMFPAPVHKEVIVRDRRGREQRVSVYGVVGGKLDDTDVAAVYQGPVDGKRRHRVWKRNESRMENQALREAGFTEAANLTREQRLERGTVEGQAAREAQLMEALAEQARVQAMQPTEQNSYLAGPLRAKTVREINITSDLRGDQARRNVANTLVGLGYQDYGEASHYLGWDRIISRILLDPSGDMGRVMNGLSGESINPLTMLTMQDTLRATIQQVFPSLESPLAAGARRITGLLENPLVSLGLSSVPGIESAGDFMSIAGDIVEGKRVRRLAADAAVTALPIPGFNTGIAGKDFDTMDAVFAGGLMYLLEDGLRNPQSPNARHRVQFAQAILNARPLEAYFNDYLEVMGVKQGARNTINAVIDRLRKGIGFGPLKLKFDFQPVEKGQRPPEALRPYAERIDTQQVIDEYNRYLLKHPDATIHSDSQLRVLHVRYRVARLIEDAREVAQQRLLPPAQQA